MGIPFGGRPTSFHQRVTQRLVVVYQHERIGDRVNILDVDETAVHAVLHDVLSLAHARRHKRDTRCQRLERRLRPSLLPRGDDTHVQRVVRPRELAATVRPEVPVWDPETLELATHVSAGGSREEDEQLRDGTPDLLQSGDEDVLDP